MTFGDRVDSVLQWLKVLVNRETSLASQDGIHILQTMDWRKKISGFDLLDLVGSANTIRSRVAPLDDWSHGWVDMLPSVRVTTILGNGFGDLIRPDEPGQVCVD